MVKEAQEEDGVKTKKTERRTEEGTGVKVQDGRKWIGVLGNERHYCQRISQFLGYRKFIKSTTKSKPYYNV